MKTFPRLSTENERAVMTQSIISVGDIGKMVDVLRFLATSADHSIKDIAFDELSKRHSEAALTLKAAVSEDGINSEELYISILHMVSGRVETDIIVAGARLGNLKQSMVDYILDGTNGRAHDRLLARRYMLYTLDFRWLEHEIITYDDTPVFVTGSTPFLGSWDPSRAVALEDKGAGRGGHHWFVRIPASFGSSIDFKFLKKNVTWEVGQNRTFKADNNASTSDIFRE